MPDSTVGFHDCNADQSLYLSIPLPAKRVPASIIKNTCVCTTKYSGVYKYHGRRNPLLDYMVGFMIATPMNHLFRCSTDITTETPLFCPGIIRPLRMVPEGPVVYSRLFHHFKAGRLRFLGAAPTLVCTAIMWRFKIYRPLKIGPWSPVVFSRWFHDFNAWGLLFYIYM